MEEDHDEDSTEEYSLLDIIIGLLQGILMGLWVVILIQYLENLSLLPN